MNPKTILVIIGVLTLFITSCAPATPTPALTNPPAQVTEAPVATEPPTEPPLACVILLTPEDGADLPPTGKVTFSWTPMDGARNYVLNITLPSGETVTFNADQTFRDRYMEAFTAGGEYKWQVTAQGVDGSEMCISKVSTFDKPEYQKLSGGGGGGSDSGGSNGGDGGGGEEGPPDIGD